ncbi:transcription factor Adf-1-like [Toxorhynchites rutilus septentrionalis]|uniref:transcription factor Adf-1-like n=1 Tax=Toxorhynchites rutilus septentrionalis TaxID=329112 RepID=UPI00247A95D2|nr:transcription factor Adf-1-like [Toxorhynchites rutilus septentrionalis]
MNQQQLLHQQQQRRRQSLLTKSVQEEYLIHQVKLRPVLYDKSLKAYRKPGATDNAWAEISNALGVKAEDCKKRWKSLRDTFIKYFRQEILVATVPGMKRKKWIYYEQMGFLRTHVELYGISETDSASDKETVQSETTRIIRIPDYVTDQTEYLTCEDAVEEHYEDNQTEYIYEDVEETSPTTFAVHAKQESLEEDNVEHIVHAHNHQKLELTQEDGNTITVPLIESVENVMNPSQTASITDPDERFLLSCAPVLKRLSTRKNALVKLRIQQLLYEVEFDEDDGGGRRQLN